MPLSQDFVRDLEEECELAIREVIESQFEGVSERTVHLMAKAAVTVLEATLEDSDM